MAAVAVVLVGQIWLALRLGSVARVFLIAQAVFWAIAFIAVPAYLLQFKPTIPALLSDSRLAPTGYDGLMGQVLWLVAASQGIYLCVLAVLAARILPPGHNARASMPPDTPTFIALAGLWSIGWAGRIASLAGIHSFESATEPFASAGSSLLIIYLAFRSSRRLPYLPLILLLLEGGWALIEGSKSAFIVPLVAVLIRWSIVPNFRRLSVGAVAVFTTSLLAGFFVLQSIKGVTTDTKAFLRAEATGSWLGGLGIGLLERFDGLSAMTDAIVANQTSGWISISDYLRRAIFNFLPKGPWAPVTESIGQQWTREVRSQSIENQFQDVSLAAGFPAEGMALAGITGLIAFSVIAALLTILAIRMFEYRLVALQVFVSPLLLSPIMFEQGLLGALGAFNKGLQLLIVFVVVYAIAAGFMRKDLHQNEDIAPWLRNSPSELPNSGH